MTYGNQRNLTSVPGPDSVWLSQWTSDQLCGRQVPVLPPFTRILLLSLFSYYFRRTKNATERSSRGVDYLRIPANFRNSVGTYDYYSLTTHTDVTLLLLSSRDQKPLPELKALAALTELFHNCMTPIQRLLSLLTDFITSYADCVHTTARNSK
jgi:hypothetical protein